MAHWVLQKTLQSPRREGLAKRGGLNQGCLSAFWKYNLTVRKIIISEILRQVLGIEANNLGKFRFSLTLNDLWPNLIFLLFVEPGNPGLSLGLTNIQHCSKRVRKEN